MICFNNQPPDSPVLQRATGLIKRDMTAHYGRHAGRYVVALMAARPARHGPAQPPFYLLAVGSWHVALKQNATWVSAPSSPLSLLLRVSAHRQNRDEIGCPLRREQRCLHDLASHFLLALNRISLVLLKEGAQTAIPCRHPQWHFCRTDFKAHRKEQAARARTP